MSPASHITVTPSEAGQKLINLLRRRLAEDVPQSALMRWIRTGQVRVDGCRAKPFDRVNKDAIIRVPPQAVLRQGGEIEPSSGSKRQVQDQSGESRPTPQLPAIIHEDEHLLVFHKPCGLAVHGGSGIKDSLAARLATHFQDAPFIPTLAHRLDRATSGLIIAAKTYEALQVLHSLLAGRELMKIYLAWVAGQWKGKGVDTLKDKLGKNRGQPFERVATGAGKQAMSLAVPLVQDKNTSLLALRLVTGRTHQLRSQLASRGHPILGDAKYQGPPSRRLRLHAWRIVLPEHELFENQSFQTDPDWSALLALPRPLPNDWRELLDG